MIQWGMHFSLDEEMRTNPINLGAHRTTTKIVTCDILKSSPEVANLITVTGLFNGEQNDGGHTPAGPAKASSAPFMLEVQFSRVQINMKHMNMLRHRDKVEPVQQRVVLHGPVLQVTLINVGARIVKDASQFEIGLLISNAQMVDLKANKGVGQRFLVAPQKTELRLDAVRTLAHESRGPQAAQHAAFEMLKQAMAAVTVRWESERDCLV